MTATLARMVAAAAFLPLLGNCAEAIKINPDNPKYFLFRGKPLVLISASEHYGSVINRPFNFEKYLDDAAEHKMTLTRTFLLYRELQSARNPSSPCKPESPDYIAPYVRSGPGKAKDGEPIYDLDQWNPEYFNRLHRFLSEASKRGIVVELTLFSNTYADNIWALNPLRAENNKQHVGQVGWQDYNTLKDPELVQRQKDYARKIIQETSEFDNIYYEICNEPGGGLPGHATPADVDRRQAEIAVVVREELNRMQRPHLIAGAQAFTYTPSVRIPLDDAFANSIVDIVNDHPLPDTSLGGHVYQMGHFMSKELMLPEVAAFCQAAYGEKKPTVLDEDNAASIYRDPVGWTIHRKRAWAALLNGAHYDYIDFSITVGSEAGTAASRRDIRTWMQHLSEFMSSFDYIHARPTTEWVKSYPGHLVASGLAVPGRDYTVYLADSRELTDPTAGQPIEGDATFVLPGGEYLLSLYSPVTGEYSAAIPLHGGRMETVHLAPFQQDLVVRVRRR